MSHDRGCMQCGIYSLDYSFCQEKTCPKRGFYHSMEVAGPAKSTELDKDPLKQVIKNMVAEGEIPASYVQKRIFQRLVKVLERARVKYYNPRLTVHGDTIIFSFKRNR